MTKKISFRKMMTNSSLVALLAAASIAPVASAEEQEQQIEVLPLAIETSSADDVIPNEYIVSFKEGVSEREMQEALADYTVLNEQFQSGLATVRLSSAQFDRLKEVVAIDIIEPNAQVELVASSELYQYSHEKTNVQAAWNRNLRGDGVKIAVIDSGIAQHEDLEIAGGTSLVSYTSSYNDDTGHGTHVAGIISALNNDYGTTGVASEAEIYAVKVLKNTGTGSLTDIIAGFDWAIEQGVDIINASLGTTYNSVAFKQRVDEAKEKGIIVVAAAGNTGNEMRYPALYDSVVAVSATNDQNQLATFSSRGVNIDLSAPGQNVMSTHLNNGYKKMSGTSMAAPYVSGMLALYKEAYPHKTANQIVELAYSNALDLGAEGHDRLFGHGIIQFPNSPVSLNPESINPSVSTDQQKLMWDNFSLNSRYEVKMDVLLDDSTYEQYRFTRTFVSEEFDLSLLEKGKKYRLSITPYDMNAYDYTKTKYVYVSFENGVPVASEVAFPLPVVPELPIEKPSIPTNSIRLDAEKDIILWETFEQAKYYQVKVEQKQQDGTFTKFGLDRQTSRLDYDLKNLVDGYTYRVSVLPRTADRKYDATKAITVYIHVDKKGQKTLSYDENFSKAPTPENPPVVEEPKDDEPATNKDVSLTASKQLVWTAIQDAKRYRVELQQKNAAGEFVKYSYNRNVSVAQFDMTSLPQGYEYYVTIVPYIGFTYDYDKAYRVYIDTATYTLK